MKELKIAFIALAWLAMAFVPFINGSNDHDFSADVRSEQFIKLVDTRGEKLNMVA